MGRNGCVRLKWGEFANELFSMLNPIHRSESRLGVHWHTEEPNLAPAMGTKPHQRPS